MSNMYKECAQHASIRQISLHQAVLVQHKETFLVNKLVEEEGMGAQNCQRSEACRVAFILFSVTLPASPTF